MELTEERERHVENRHPELLPAHRDKLAEVLADPDVIQRTDDEHLFSRWYTDIGRGRYIVVVVISQANRPARHWIVTAYMTRRLRRGRDRMASKLTLEYDRVGDILYISNCAPYAEQESEELGDQIIARLNPVTGHVENLEVLFFSRRILQGGRWELPVTADLYPDPD